jgi:RimJ/RimL family protein N-acetyltransferase
MCARNSVTEWPAQSPADIILKTSLLKTRAAMVLHTHRLLLREFIESDAAEANSYEADPAVVRFATHGVRSLADSLAYIQGVRREARSEIRRVFEFAIVRNGDAQLIGRCGLRLSDTEPTEAMLWYVLVQRAWGRGYAAEAARAVLTFGFEELRLHRIFVDIDPRNAASLRVAEKVGLRREGHFVETTWTKGEWADSVVFALLDREYRAQWLRVPMRATRRG